MKAAYITKFGGPEVLKLEEVPTPRPVAGQVLVLHDMLGITKGKLPRFVRNFMADVGQHDKPVANPVAEAVRRYVAAVKDGSYPDAVQHGYQ